MVGGVYLFCSNNNYFVVEICIAWCRISRESAIGSALPGDVHLR
jgi:hypothetical protein